ncbi:MAG: hypothetical protein DMG69_23285 [Acidobacteria bacterium]|nr:MAG: hypothetical protein DMG69_23285 [Acidobacteriota bacterium]
MRKKLIPQDAPQVMVIDIPESDNPPHQNLYDKKYYRRSGTESLPMEHDLVASYFGRKTGPILKANFHALAKPTEFTGDPPFSNEFRVRVTIDNSGKRVGKYVEAIFIFPAPITCARSDGVEFGMTSVACILAYRPGNSATTSKFSILEMSSSILEIGFTVSKTYLDGHADDTFILWTIYADEMEPQQGSITLREVLT